jgi:beta-glucanase (GH16 family)
MDFHVPTRPTRTLLAIACTTLFFGTIFGSTASASNKALSITAPKAGVVAFGKIPVRAKLNFKRKSRVVRARFYIGKKLVTTDKRYPFALKKGVMFDTRKIPAWGQTLKLTVRFEQRTGSGTLKSRKLERKVRIKLNSAGDGIDGLDADCLGPTVSNESTAGLPYDPLALPQAPEGMFVCEAFNGTQLDRRLWNDQRSDPGSGNYPWFAWNSDMEGAHYSPNNVSIAGGMLTMFVTDVPSGVVAEYPGHQRPKTTGSVNTDGKFAFRYGTMEARIRYSECGACWQSFWLRNQEQTVRPEYDVMEHMPWGEPSPYTVIHGLVGPPPVNGAQHGNQTLNLAGAKNNLSDTWHTYRITRSAASMSITIDHRPEWSFTTTDPNLATDAYMYAILSMAIIDPTKAPGLGIPTPPPAPAGSKIEVDYLKVWKPGYGPVQP